MTVRRDVSRGEPGAAPRRPVPVFLASAAEDELYRRELEKHLSLLEERDLVRVWHRSKTRPGEDRDAVAEERIGSSAIVVLLLSVHLLASKEGKADVDRAMERRKAREARVVPILVRRFDWESYPFGTLSPLPENGEPITHWRSPDDAWDEIARAIKAMVEEILAKPPSMRPPPSSQQAITPRVRGDTVPVYSSAEARALGERLQQSYERKRRLEERGEPIPADLKRKIRSIKQELRAAGQLQAGDLLGDGRYLLLSLLGKGGFASVWRAHDDARRMEVAVKVLHSNLAGDRHRLERFERGARIMMRLRHPTVVCVLDGPGDDIGWRYFVMELLRGGDLRRAVLDRRVSPQQVLPIILRVGGALAEAHAGRWIHRDVKPENILLDSSGAAKLTDFDLVGGPDTTGGTETGALGTFVYAAPELLDRPQDADARVDVFGLGMTAIFGLLGRDLTKDFVGEGKPDPFIARLPCSEPVKAVLKQAVEWRPEARFADASELCAALARAVGTRPPPPPEPPPDSLPEPTLKRPKFGSEILDGGPPATNETVRMIGAAADLRDAPILRIEDAVLELCLAPKGVPTGTKFHLSANPVRIGRVPPSDYMRSSRGGHLVLPHKSVSRRHARIELRGFSLFLIDEGSTNGTYITAGQKPTENDRVYSIAMLQHRDAIYFGNEYMLRLDFTPAVVSPQYSDELRRENVDLATKHYSRRYLDWCLERDVLSAQRRRQDVALLLLSARERPGPQTEPRKSDELAAQLAGAVQPHVQAGAVVGRFGPRELGVLVPGWTTAKISRIGAAVERAAPPDLVFRYGAAELMNGDRDGAEGIRKRAVEALREAEREGPGETALD